VTGKRTTLRGTAIMALDVVAPGTARAQPATGPVRRPVAVHHARYAQRAQAYQALYDAVIAPAIG
jgi:gluconokinase